jgi:hypothetical protein
VLIIFECCLLKHNLILYNFIQSSQKYFIYIVMCNIMYDWEFLYDKFYSCNPIFTTNLKYTVITIVSLEVSFVWTFELFYLLRKFLCGTQEIKLHILVSLKNILYVITFIQHWFMHIQNNNITPTASRIYIGYTVSPPVMRCWVHW